MTTTLVAVRRVGMSLEAFSAATGLHPDLVRRLVALGALDPVFGPDGELRFPRSQVAAAARMQRLRAGLSLNYAALGLVGELLDRIDALENALRRRRPPPPGRLSASDNEGDDQWTRNG